MCVVKIGDTVQTQAVTGRAARARVVGTVAFVGATEFAKGDWVGIDLFPEYAQYAKNDGSVAGQRYFATRQLATTGLFVRPATVTVVSDDTTADDVDLLKHRLEVSVVDNEALKAANEQLTVKLECIQREMDVLARRLHSGGAVGTAQEVNLLYEQIDALTTQLQSTTEELKRLYEANENLATQVDNVQRLHSVIEKLNAEITSYQIKLENQQADKHSTELKYTAVLTELNSMIQDLNDQLNVQYDKVDFLESKLVQSNLAVKKLKERQPNEPSDEGLIAKIIDIQNDVKSKIMSTSMLDNTNFQWDLIYDLITLEQISSNMDLEDSQWQEVNSIAQVCINVLVDGISLDIPETELSLWLESFWWDLFNKRAIQSLPFRWSDNLGDKKVMDFYKLCHVISAPSNSIGVKPCEYLTEVVATWVKKDKVQMDLLEFEYNEQTEKVKEEEEEEEEKDDDDDDEYEEKEPQTAAKDSPSPALPNFDEIISIKDSQIHHLNQKLSHLQSICEETNELKSSNTNMKSQLEKSQRDYDDLQLKLQEYKSLLNSFGIQNNINGTNIQKLPTQETIEKVTLIKVIDDQRKLISKLALSDETTLINNGKHEEDEDMAWLSEPLPKGPSQSALSKSYDTPLTCMFKLLSSI